MVVKFVSLKSFPHNNHSLIYIVVNKKKKFDSYWNLDKTQNKSQTILTQVEGGALAKVRGDECLGLHSLLHLPTSIWSLPMPTSNCSPLDLFLVWFGAELVRLSHGCCRHRWAVGRFSGEKSRRGTKKSANSRASDCENLYLSTSSRSRGQDFSLRILFRSPCLSKRSFDLPPPMATCF